MQTFKLMMQAFFDAADGKKVIVVSDRPEYLCKRLDSSLTTIYRKKQRLE